MELLNIRNGLGVSQNVFANRMGLPLRALEDLETGRTTTQEVHIRAAFWAAMELASEMSMPGALPEDVHDIVRKLAATMDAVA